MGIDFDAGYTAARYRILVGSFPDASVYPPSAFRVEWGPIFHRGRLDGTARVLVIGQDPATHESICRRILVGEAGQRVQGFLAKLGITRSYVLVNAFLYPVYTQSEGERHVDDPAIVAYRNRWLDTLAAHNDLEAIVALGHVADGAYATWRATPAGAACTATYAAVTHPTYPEAAARGRKVTKAEAFAHLCASWNDALTKLHPKITPDAATPLRLYGKEIVDTDLAPIPAVDLPPGLPDWMRSLDTWARRSGTTAETKRATLTVSIPGAGRTWLATPDAGGSGGSRRNAGPKGRRST
jgi:uracil-DNA glycosylase